MSPFLRAVQAVSKWMTGGYYCRIPRERFEVPKSIWGDGRGHHQPPNTLDGYAAARTFLPALRAGLG